MNFYPHFGALKSTVWFSISDIPMLKKQITKRITETNLPALPEYKLSLQYWQCHMEVAIAE